MVTIDTQVLLNGLVAGSAYGLVGLSFTIVYRLGKFFDLTPAAGCITGAYASLVVANQLGWPAWLALIIAVLVPSSLGVLSYAIAYRPLLANRRGPSEKFLASLGLLVVTQSAIAIGFGEDTKILAVAGAGIHRLGNLSVTDAQLWSVAAATGLWILAALGERYSEAGRRYRAVVADEELAQIVGVRTGIVRSCAAGVSLGLAGLAGILIGADIGLTPGMGFRAILMGVVAAVIGGIGSFRGVMLGALLIGITQNLVAWWISSAWQDAATFVLLIVFLIARPQGILGKPLRRTSV